MSTNELSGTQRDLLRQIKIGGQDLSAEQSGQLDTALGDGVIYLDTEIANTDLKNALGEFDRNKDGVIDSSDFQLSDTQKNILNQIKINNNDLTPEQKAALEAALNDGVIYLEEEITDNALKEILQQFDTNNDGMIDSLDNFPTTPANNGGLIAFGDGHGVTDLFANVDLTGWTQVMPGVFVNKNTHQIYLGDDSSGTISIKTILENSQIADLANAGQYTVIMDDDNGNCANVIIDAGINELIIDNDSLNGTGAAVAKVTFTSGGSVNSIWNDVDAIRADINTSITGVNSSAKIRNTNDLDISQDIAAKISNATKATQYNVTRTLESAGNAVLNIEQDDLGISGNIKVTGDGSQIANPTFGSNVKVNVTDNRNFTATKATAINLDVDMSISNLSIDTASANAMNGGNIFSLNLDAQGTGEITYGLAGKINQEIANSKFGDEKAAPQPRRCDPYNILEINVVDSANVCHSSTINLERKQIMENLEIGAGVAPASGTAKLTLPFINGTYVDQAFFGNNTHITGQQTVGGDQQGSVNNKSANAILKIRNENIWLAAGEDESKYRTMSSEDVAKLPATQFFAGGAQSVKNITGNYEALNNGKTPGQSNALATVDIEPILRKMAHINQIVRDAARVDTNNSNHISLEEFKVALNDQGLTDEEITQVFNNYAASSRLMTYAEYNTFIAALPTAGTGGPTT
jgi:Ca2+-binding EF-hand superfamily protein